LSLSLTGKSSNFSPAKTSASSDFSTGFGKSSSLASSSTIVLAGAFGACGAFAVGKGLDAVGTTF
jgi:hypothetical protein